MKNKPGAIIIILVIISMFQIAMASAASLDLGTLLGGTASDASSINDRGQIVGFSSTDLSGNHATLWQP